MPDLLLELFSEEIPARMQRKAADDLRKLITDALVERGFLYEGAKAFATPRRLALHIAGLPAKGQDVVEEKKGPRIDAPAPAIQGFLKSAGLTDVSEATIVDDPKKGSFYIAKAMKPGRATIAVLAEIIPDIIRSFPWPKSMRWGAASAQAGSLKWVRPLQSILCTFGPETEEPEIVRFEVGGIASGNVTFGHRFHSPAAITVRRFDDYVSSLEKAHVVLDADRRKDIILHDARNLAFAQGLELVEDDGLLEEVAGLVEWPVVLMGSFDEAFLDMPPEVIRATIRANQKCFVVRPLSSFETPRGAAPQDEGGADISRKAPHGTKAPHAGEAAIAAISKHKARTLAPRFILTANIAASDGGVQIIAGNERVVRARLSDAKYFWQTDRADLPDLAGLKASADTLGLHLTKPLDQRMAKLEKLGVVFHQKLGSQGERVQRIVALARELATFTGADPDLCARAALLAKADLTTEMVGEFPELQGLIGRYYAERQGEHASVCAAIEDHYKPLGPGDRVPTDPVAITVALADKLDTLVGFWAIDEKPTGSKDPYALRRAALGVIRLVFENGVRIDLDKLFNKEIEIHFRSLSEETITTNILDLAKSMQKNIDSIKNKNSKNKSNNENRHSITNEIVDSKNKISDKYFIQKFRVKIPEISSDLLAFFHDRLKVQLREQGVRHDLVDAVLRSSVMVGLVANDDLVLIVRRVEALTAFLATEDGAKLLEGTKRAVRFVEQAEKLDGEGAFEAAPDPALLVEPEEKALAGALDAALPEAKAAIAAENFAGAMAALAGLRAPVYAFADKVLVNANDPALRVNRLRLLAQLRATMRTIADFGKVAG